MEMPLPPRLRRIQQNPYWQYFGQPFAIGLLLDVGACLFGGVPLGGAMLIACGMGLGKSYITGLLNAIAKDHGTGSASFHPDGNPNRTVANVVAVQQVIDKAPTPELVEAATKVVMAADNAAALAEQYNKRIIDSAVAFEDRNYK